MPARRRSRRRASSPAPSTSGSRSTASSPTLAKGETLPNFVRGGYDKDYVQNTAYGAGATPEAIKAADDAAKAEMKALTPIFVGPLKDNTGKEVIAAGNTYAPYDVWLEQTNYPRRRRGRLDHLSAGGRQRPSSPPAQPFLIAGAGCLAADPRPDRAPCHRSAGEFMDRLRRSARRSRSRSSRSSSRRFSSRSSSSSSASRRSNSSPSSGRAPSARRFSWQNTLVRASPAHPDRAMRRNPRAARPRHHRRRGRAGSRRLRRGGGRHPLHRLGLARADLPVMIVAAVVAGAIWIGARRRAPPLSRRQRDHLQPPPLLHRRRDHELLRRGRAPRSRQPQQAVDPLDRRGRT